MVMIASKRVPGQLAHDVFVLVIIIDALLDGSDLPKILIPLSARSP